jgi:hypothetical protein
VEIGGTDIDSLNLVLLPPSIEGGQRRNMQADPTILNLTRTRISAPRAIYTRTLSCFPMSLRTAPSRSLV